MSVPVEAPRTCSAFGFFIPGKARGQGRPRADRRAGGHMHSDRRTENASANVQAVWREAGCPRLSPGPFILKILVFRERPKGHYRADGKTLTKAGEEGFVPTSKPDLSNVAKLVEDALTDAGAWEDDRFIVDLQVRRTYVGGERWDDPHPAVPGIYVSATRRFQ